MGAGGGLIGYLFCAFRTIDEGHDYSSQLAAYEAIVAGRRCGWQYLLMGYFLMDGIGLA